MGTTKAITTPRPSGILLGIAAIVQAFSLLTPLPGAYSQELSSAERQRVFETIRHFDNLYSAGMTVQGTSRHIRHVSAPDTSEYPIEFIFTKSDNTVAYTFLALESPKFVKRIDTDGIQSQFVAGWVYSGPEEYGCAHLSAISEVQSLNLDDLMTMSDRVAARIVLYPPRPTRLMAPARSVLHTIGRGFTGHATECTLVKPRGDTLLEVHLLSDELGEGSRWELLVDSELAYLAREARLYRSGDSAPRTEVMTEGLLQTGDALFIPSSASVWDRPYLTKPQPFEFTSAARHVDEELIHAARNALLPDSYPEITVSFTDASDPSRPRIITEKVRGLPPRGFLSRVYAYFFGCVTYFSSPYYN